MNTWFQVAVVLLTATLGLQVPAQVQPRQDHPPNTLHILSYHDIAAHPGQLIDDYAITVDQLAAQFSWLKQQGYTVVRLDDVLAASRGERALPAKAVMLTFDDGLASVHRYALPLLKVFNYPAMVALMGRWLTDEFDWPLTYGSTKLERNHFLSRAQLRELAASGLVEFASHSYDLHHGVQGNDAGHMQPAATTRKWSVDAGQREETAQYQARLERDLKRSVALIKELTGQTARVMVWPYGEYSGPGLRAAAAAGMPLSMGLSNQPNAINGPIQRTLQRYLISSRTEIVNFAYQFAYRPESPARFVSLELSQLENVPTAQFAERFDRLVDRVYKVGATHVFIDLLTIDRMEDRFNLINQVAWQLRTRVGVDVLLRWRLPPHSAPSEAKLENLRAFRFLIEYVPVAGIVLKLEDDFAMEHDAMAYTAALRSEQPDDPVIWAPMGQTEASIRRWVQALGKRSPDRFALLISLPPAEDVQRLARQQSAGVDDIRVWREFTGPFTTEEDQNRLLAHMRALQRAGHAHFGWGPDDFMGASPALEAVVPVFSRRAYLR
jgi:peptidoglycan/xylan/chitin deacetylase (PgdA/CDA1 family)